MLALYQAGIGERFNLQSLSASQCFIKDFGSWKLNVRLQTFTPLNIHILYTAWLALTPFLTTSELYRVHVSELLSSQVGW